MTIKKSNLLFVFLVLFGLMFSGSPAFSAVSSDDQDAVDVPEALSPDAISSLVSKMDAEQTDALVKLIEVLDHSVGSEKAIADTEATPVLDALKGWTVKFGESLIGRVRGLPTMFTGMALGVSNVFSSRGFGGSILFLGLLALTLIIGYGAEWLLSKLFSKSADAVKTQHSDTLLGTLKLLSTRAMIQAFGIVVFLITALIAAKFIFPDLDDRWIASTLIVNVIILVRISAAILRFVLAPGRADLRLVSTDGKTAKFLFKQLVYVVVLLGVGLFIGELMLRSSLEGVKTLRFWLGLISVIWIMVVTWLARNGLTSMIIGDEEDLTPGLKKIASWWPKASIALLGLLWLLITFIATTGSGAMTPGRGILIMALVVVLPFLDTMVRGIAGHLVPPMEGSGPIAEKAYLDTRLSYVRIGRVFLFAFLVTIVAKLLGMNLRDLAESGLGAEIAANAIGFLMILAIGYLSLEVVNLWVNRRLVKEIPAAASGGADNSDGGGAGKSRMATILPILRMTLKVAIIMLTVLLALGQVGVNTAPLLAGAGVLGLAIGFGAQTLVKDVVSGVFFLLDDAFRMGEYIDVGGTAGTVEKISIRSIQLRGVKGPVHIIPYGSMSSLTNLSRDWVIVKLKFTVPFDTDIDQVRRIFKKVGKQIAELPEYKDDLLAPFKSQGAADITDVGIVIKGKFMTKPGGQWMIKREIYTRLQTMFKQYGIEFARKEIRVQMPDSGDASNLSAEQKTAIAGAAGEGAEEKAKEGDKA